MLALSVFGNITQIEEGLQRAAPFVDLIEWRFDLLANIDKKRVRKWIEESSLPAIFTFRFPEEKTNWSKEEWLAWLDLSPCYIDLPWNTSLDFVSSVRGCAPNAKLIASYHNYFETPSSLEKVLHKMNRFPVAMHKIATFARSSLDALRMLAFVKKHREGKLSATCMGMLGSVTRIVAPIVGSAITYVAAEKGKETAPGQLPLDTLKETYRFHNLKKGDPIYALIGNPLGASPGYLCHNAMFTMLNKNGVYVNIPLCLDELERGMSLLSSLPFRGISITMPLKKAITSYIDSLDRKAQNIGAINTLLRTERGWKGYNTDATGALDAIERKATILGKVVLVLGMGGAGSAIAVEATLRGAKVKIFSRRKELVIKYAEQCKAEGYLWDTFPDVAAMGYDVLVQATPIGMVPHTDVMPIEERWILPKSIIFETIIRPKETRLIQVAKEKDCFCIYGYEMYARQAAKQLDIWFSPLADQEKVVKAIETICINHLWK